MSEAQQQQEEPQLPETVPVENLNDFVRILQGWHSQQVTAVQQLLDCPVGATFQVGEDEEIVLTPPVRAGYRLGIELVMMKLGKLPFVAEIEAADAADELETASAAG